MKKKLISVLMALALVVGLIPMTVHATDSGVPAIVDYVNNQVGKNMSDFGLGPNSCQAYVWAVFYGCYGITNTQTICCATKAWQVYGVSTSRDNIPLGAAVYFENRQVVDDCGQYAGHVGVYVGNNQVVNARSGKIYKDDIDYLINNFWSMEWRGWGWQGGYVLSSENTSISNDPPTAPSYVTVEWSNQSAMQARVSWPAVDGATSYEVEYNHGNDAWRTEPDYTSATVTSFVATGVGHTSYYYRVRAVNSGGKSDWTVGTFGGTTASKPSATQPYVSATEYVRGSDVTIQWDKVSDATSYFINVYIDGEHPLSRNIGNTTTHTLTNVGKGEYVVYIEAINDSGASDALSCSFSVVESQKYFIDLNGYIDGEDTTGIEGCGTVDIYINDKLVASGVTDYYSEWPTGTRYEIKNITVNDGYEYIGMREGSLTGVVGTTRVNARLSFSKKQTHTHSLTYTSATAAKCTTAGNIEYWFCPGCDKYFSDSSAKNETTKTRTVVAALGHYYVNGKCTRCGETNPNIEWDDPNFTNTNTYQQGQFKDVPTAQWFTESVAGAYRLGLMKGNSDTTFNPYGDVTLAEAITMASRIHSIYTTGTEGFVQSGSKWYQVYLDYALDHGIISADFYNNSVDVKATRAQFAEIFAKALPDKALYPKNSISDNAIPDVRISDVYAPYVYKLYRAGILTGGDALGTFSPRTFITRAEAATIVSRMAQGSERKDFSLQ